jgi:hypothetical protein
MTKWLFGAEADKIQVTLFRAARQRQVVGGSSLLAQFEEYARAIAKTEFGLNADDLLVTAGGSFRLLFRDEVITKKFDGSKTVEQAAQEFGEQLANAYRILLDAHLTVADTVQVTSRFQDANKEIGEKIRARKDAATDYETSPHAPTTAYCQSSGVGLAEFFEPRTPAEPRAEYLSMFAFSMRDAGRVADKDFLSGVKPANDAWVWMNDVDWANEADEIAAFDGERKNVAYLLADGNNMGKLFAACDEKQIRALSVTLTNALFAAAAKAIPQLAHRLRERQQTHKQGDQDKRIIPALPLILAGDDAFILLPALYSLAYAREFCLEFERMLKESEVVQALVKQNGVPSPSIAAALVICKGHYPYTLVYRRGQALLKQTKQMIKTAALSTGGQAHSAMAVDAIVGSEILARADAPRKYEPSLSPYWIPSETALSESEQLAGIGLDVLLEQRFALKKLSAKRLAELRTLYSLEQLPKDSDSVPWWEEKLEQLKKRIIATAREKKPRDLDALNTALRVLGNEKDGADGHWRTVGRAREIEYYAHGLPDVIALWNYAQDLKYDLSAYRQEE